MAALAALPAWLQTTMAVMSAVSTIAQGEFAARQGNAQAKQMERMAGSTEALSQRDAIQEWRQARAVAGQARAIAGASGAGVDDPSMESLYNRIESQGDFNALSRLYDGTINANDMRAQAGALRAEGKATRTAMIGKTIADLGSSMIEKGMFSKTTKKNQFAFLGDMQSTFELKDRKKNRRSVDATLNTDFSGY